VPAVDQEVGWVGLRSQCGALSPVTPMANVQGACAHIAAWFVLLLTARYNESVELSYFEVRHAISKKGFKFLKESTTSCTYAANKLSIMKTQYTCLFFTAQKL
jgi:hypothetical protein